MIPVCIKPGCINSAASNAKFCDSCLAHHYGNVEDYNPSNTQQVVADCMKKHQQEAEKRVNSPEFSGSNVNYYLVKINDPKRLDPYEAECEDIIEALGMTFAEGCAFKAIWRSCAQRTLGHMKRGQDAHGVYDAEKVQYYGGRMLAQRKRKTEADK